MRAALLTSVVAVGLAVGCGGSRETALDGPVDVEVSPVDVGAGTSDGSDLDDPDAPDSDDADARPSATATPPADPAGSPDEGEVQGDDEPPPDDGGSSGGSSRPPLQPGRPMSSDDVVGELFVLGGLSEDGAELVTSLGGSVQEQIAGGTVIRVPAFDLEGTEAFRDQLRAAGYDARAIAAPPDVTG